MTTALLYHAGEVLYCSAFILREILWLRVLCFIAATIQLPYFYLQPEPLWEPVFWTSAFLAVNGIGLVRLLRDRRPVALTPDEERLQMLVFRSLHPRELLRVLSLAEWREGKRGERVIERGTRIDGLMVLFEGVAHVEIEGNVVAHLRDGQFMGEMSFVRRQPTSADVVFAESCRYVHWPRERLDRLLARDPGLERAFQALLGQDMANKLHRMSA